jgi:hypothetical protein
MQKLWNERPRGHSLSIHDKSSDEPRSYQGQGGVDKLKNYTDNDAVSDEDAEIEIQPPEPKQQQTAKVIDDVYDPRILSDPTHKLSSLQKQLNYWHLSLLHLP